MAVTRIVHESSDTTCMITVSCDVSFDVHGLIWLDEHGCIHVLDSPKPAPKSCAQCNATNLDQFFTSKRGGRTLCQACFDQLADKGVAKEEGQLLRKPTKLHPLDEIANRPV